MQIEIGLARKRWHPKKTRLLLLSKKITVVALILIQKKKFSNIDFL